MEVVVFDLDNTLAKTGAGMTQKDLRLLRRLEKQGLTVAVCSGKTTDYLCGFMRQTGLKRPVLLGENGAVIQIGIELPPKRIYRLPYSEKAAESIDFLRKELDEILPHIWYQPNMVGLTPFPSKAEEFEIIAECLENNKSNLKEILVYRHEDSFDIVPEGIDKGRGIRFMGEVLNVPLKRITAVGDGVNDYPMFECAGFSIGINVKEPERVDINFEVVTEALEYILCRKS